MKASQSRNLRRAVEIVFAAGLASGAAQAAHFVSISTLQGESQAKDYKNWSDVISYSQTVSQGDCAIFSVSKEVDTITPAMAEAAANGGKFDSAIIASTATYGDGGSVEYFRAAMKDVYVQAARHAGGQGGAGVTDDFVLAPSFVTLTYIQQDSTGKTKGTVVKSYSCKVKR